MDEQKTLQILLQYGLDQQSVQNAAKDTDKLTDSLRKQEVQLRQNRMALREIGQIGTAVALAGAAIYAPALKAASDYIRSAGQTEQVSAKWLGDQTKIKNAYIDVGRVVATGLLPSLTKAADLAQQFSQWAEKNPKLVEALVSAGGVMVLAGGALKIGAELGRAVVDVQLLAAKLMDTAAGKQLMAAGEMALATGIVIAATGAAAAGSGAIVNKTTGRAGTGLASDFGTTAGMLGTWIDILKNPKNAAALAASFLTGNNTGTTGGGWEKAISGLLGGSSAGGAVGTGSNQNFAESNVQMFVDYQKQIIAAEKSYGQQRADTVEQYAKQVADTEANYAKQRDRAMRDFATQEQQSETDYYKNRTNEVRDYGLQASRAEEDHQRDMLQLQRDHNDRVANLVSSRDALGLVKEQRAYETQRADKEDQYNLEVSRRNQDEAIRLSDMESQFRDERARRLASFQQTQADQDADHKAQMKALADNQAETLKKLKQGYDDQIQQIQTAFIDRIRALDPTVLGDYRAFQNYMVTMANQFRSWLGQATSNLPGVNPTPTVTNRSTRASGGYAQFLGENAGEEYVLANSTTRLIERITGGRLTQQKLIASMVAGAAAQGGNARNYYDQKRINFGNMTSADRAVFRREMRQVADDALGEAFK